MCCSTALHLVPVKEMSIPANLLGTFRYKILSVEPAEFLASTSRACRLGLSLAHYTLVARTQGRAASTMFRHVPVAASASIIPAAVSLPVTEASPPGSVHGQKHASSATTDIRAQAAPPAGFILLTWRT